MTAAAPGEESPATILQALQAHVASQGESVIYTFLKSDQERLTLTYRALDERARSIAHELLSHAQPGDRALLTYPPGLEFIEAFLGCLYAGIIAVPAYPPKKNRNAERVLAIAHDCEPRLLLCTGETRENLLGEFVAAVSGAQVLATDDIGTHRGSGLPEITPDRLAFLQYTSGSTAAPKGVMVSHGNLLANEIAIRHAFQHDHTSVVCSWLPAFHDMGLIGTVLQPLFVGCPSILMSPVSFLSRPIRWLQAISEFRGTSSGGPNFAFEHCLNLIDEPDCLELDLSCWRVAFNGAEPVRRRTLDRFSDRFSTYGFRRESFMPCYGLAETTLFVSGGPAGTHPRDCTLHTLDLGDTGLIACNEPPSDEYSVVSCGTIGHDLEVAVVSPTTFHRLPDKSVGEIWVRGSSVSRGYWRKPSGDQTFEGIIRGTTTAERFLRTGDLGFLFEGQLHVTGRLKDLIIIRGRNVYPQDIEQVVERHISGAAANSVAAFSVWAKNEERLTLVIEAPRTLVRRQRIPMETATLESQIASLLANIRHDIAATFNLRVEYVAFLEPGHFPRTSSGKVQRRACKAALQKGALPFLKIPGCVTSLKQASHESGVLRIPAILKGSS